MSAAIAEAHKSSFDYKNGSEFRLGSVVLSGDEIISRGYNIKSVNETFKRLGYRSSIHAESLALYRAKGKGDTLVVVRILKNGSLTMSAPCSLCFAYAKRCGIKRIFFSDWNGSIQEMEI